jgi:hypothetical protein
MNKEEEKPRNKIGYICPNCKKWQKGITEWSNRSEPGTYDLKTQDYEYGDSTDSDHERYCCPECDEDLDYDFVKEVAPLM